MGIETGITRKKMKQGRSLRKLAKLISYILHPVFFPTVMTLALCFLEVPGFSGIDFVTKWKWVGIAAFQTIFFPLVTIFLMWRLKFIKSIFLRTQKERVIPLMAVMVFYFWVYEVFKGPLHAPFILNVFFLGAFWGIIVLYIVTIFIKASMHTTAAGGMMGVMVLIMFMGNINFLIPFLVALLIAGVVGTARMILRAHAGIEIWLGYSIGFLTQIGAYFFLK